MLPDLHLSVGVLRRHCRHRALAALALAVGAAATLPINAAVEERSYEVIPSGWVTGNGSAPGAVTAGTGQAFVFPSTVPGEQTAGKVTFALTGALKPSAHFPDPHDHDHPFEWSDSGSGQISITVVRKGSQSPDLAGC